MTMRDLIEKLKERPKSADEHLAEQKKEWLEELERLFARVETWLAPATGAGVLAAGRSTIEVTEDELGSYEAPSLSITDGKLTVRMEPVGTRVVGVVAGGKRHTGFRGLVNLISGPTKVALVRTPSNEWKALPLRGEPLELNEETFAELLGEFLLDE